MEYKKVSDESNDTYEDREYFSYEQLVADDRRDNAEWNNSLHPNQKKYPGMTRLQVLMANINPTLRKYDKLTLSRFIGERVETSIRRNSTVRVAYEVSTCGVNCGLFFPLKTLATPDARRPRVHPSASTTYHFLSILSGLAI